MGRCLFYFLCATIAVTVGALSAHYDDFGEIKEHPPLFLLPKKTLPDDGIDPQIYEEMVELVGAIKNTESLARVLTRRLQTMKKDAAEHLAHTTRHYREQLAIKEEENRNLTVRNDNLKSEKNALHEEVSLINSRILITKLDQERSHEYEIYEPRKERRSRRKYYEYLFKEYRDTKNVKSLLDAIHSTYNEGLSKEEKEQKFINNLPKTWEFLCKEDHYYIWTRNRNLPLRLRKEINPKVAAILTVLSKAATALAESYLGVECDAAEKF